MNIILNKGSIVSDGVREYIIRKSIGRGASAVAYMADCRNGKLEYSCILKEYNPAGLDISRNDDLSLDCKQEEEFHNGMKRFISSGYMQNNIREKLNMRNQTPPVSNIFEANKTAYIDVVCFDGASLDKLTELSPTEYTEIMLAVSKNVSAYHDSGCLCLDLKPENIFVLLDSSGDPVTQLVEFIDFDSVRTENSTNKYLYYTREWASPEQTDRFSSVKISKASDIYTLGEIAFWIYFGRHSEDSEHRGFSKYDFDNCKNNFRTILKRPSVQKLLTQLFRNTLRPSVNNRFHSVNDVVAIFEKLVDETVQKDFVIPIFPHISPDFTGRDEELKIISESLEINSLLWVYGIGGIGKSTIVRNFIHQKKAEYDVIIYLEYDKNIIRTFTDDRQLKLSTVRKDTNETPKEYFYRKLEILELICTNKKVLFVIDNFDGLITKEFSLLMRYGWHTLIVSRRKPPENSFTSLHIEAFSDTNELYSLISLNLRRSLTSEEKSYFDEIIKITEGHTLTLELIARQISAGNIAVSDALELIKENGFLQLSDEKINNYKDGEEIYGTLSAIISSLFDCSGMSDSCRTYLKVISLIDYRGFEKSFVYDILKLNADIISKLAFEGWLYNGDVIRVHPVISETVQNWKWPDTERDIQIMKHHKNVISIYESMGDHEQILKIACKACEYAELHKRDIIVSMCHDMFGSFYDTVLGGIYESEDEDELEMIRCLHDSVFLAVKYSSEPQNTEEAELLCRHLLSLASVCIRSGKDEEDENTALECLCKAFDIADTEFENYDDFLCLYMMVSATYFTYIAEDIETVCEYIEEAHNIAPSAYQTDIEIIDIVYIPASDCYFSLQEYDLAIAELDKALEICLKYPDVPQYSDKYADIITYLLDVYFEMENYTMCALMIAIIDKFNDEHCDIGIFKHIEPYVRETVSKNL
ncbi:MAG: serine/threonine protein kinase [Ruminococcus sp.]|nr:serine/threonine protein kinase [Ruminococcus sp.]